MLQRIRKFENMHILFWLGKDISWCLELKTLGILMIAPTITLAIVLTWLSRHNVKELLHNLAVCFWIAANSLWMLGEFIGHEEFRQHAIYLFGAGAFCIIFYYAANLMGFIKHHPEL